MGPYVRLFGITLFIFLAIDMVWLGWIARTFYKKHIGHLLKKNVNWLAAVIFYLIFIAGLIFFVIHPALINNSFSYALLAGGLFGLVTYSTYDLTNHATVKGWPLTVTLADLAWGSFLASATASLSYLISVWFNVI